MDDQTHSVQESTDMSISSDDNGIEQQKKSKVELKKDHGEAVRHGAIQVSFCRIFISITLFLISTSTSNSPYVFFGVGIV
jgi:hypothetical protein